MSNEIQKVDSSVVAKLQEAMELGFSASQMKGFEKAFSTANAISVLKGALNAKTMQPIMSLQGTRLGFRTDKDKQGGYALDVVKNSIIEAILFGVQPTGNQFNIIAGNTYITKEGFTYLLNNIEGLNYEIVMLVPEPFSKSIKTKAVVKWNYNGDNGEKTLEFVVSAFGGNADAANGKGERRAKCWLYNYITGNTLTDGEAEKQVEDQSNSAKVSTIIEEEGNKIDFETGEIIEEAKENSGDDIPGQLKINLDDTDDMKI